MAQVTVVPCKIEAGNIYAVKINKKYMQGKERIARNEVMTMRRISQMHRNMHDYFETLNNSNIRFATNAEDTLLVTGFENSQISISSNVLTTVCGIPGYMAPEMYKRIGYGKPVDLWALGVITFWLPKFDMEGDENNKTFMCEFRICDSP
ncbi:hypothetical protein C2G38_2276405 [Gigaspora rosea]|uniref:Protein kinase domain-containing protein n=1 Tax=Gigaspora rosea TaxID=44941 RepID=A0A397U922_9GLOM|nr:hypothetical protein C2G38_2276405 [Gigaspora rosea]